MDNPSAAGLRRMVPPRTQRIREGNQGIATRAPYTRGIFDIRGRTGIDRTGNA